MLRVLIERFIPEKGLKHESFGKSTQEKYTTATEGIFVLFIERQEDGSLDYTYKTWNGNKFPQMPFCDHSIREIVRDDINDNLLTKMTEESINRERIPYEYICLLVQKGEIDNKPAIIRARMIVLPRNIPADQIDMNFAQIIENQLGASASMKEIQKCVDRTLAANPWGNTSHRKRL